MPSSAAQSMIATVALTCPICFDAYNHVQESLTGEGFRASPRSGERLGTKILMQGECGHAWILGVGEHKGEAFLYVREPLGGEVEETFEYTSSEASGRVSFTRKPEPEDWHPGNRDAHTDLEFMLEGAPAK